MLKTLIISLGILCCCASCDYFDGRDDVLKDDVLRESDLPDSVIVYVDREVPVAPVRSVRDWYVDTLKSYLGAKEDNGSNRGAEIDMFFTDCGVPPGNFWCGCFVGFGLTGVGANVPSAPAWSPAYFSGSRVVWVRGVDNYNVVFREGDLFGVYFNSLKRIAHVGVIVEDFGNNYFLTIEGNGNMSGSREGTSVIMKIRHKSEVYKVADWIK